MQTFSLSLLLLSLLAFFSSSITCLPHIPRHPLSLPITFIGFQHQLLNLTLHTQKIYNIISYQSFVMNVKWDVYKNIDTDNNNDKHIDNTYRLIPTQIGLIIGADQVHIHMHKNIPKITINGHKYTHGIIHDIGNLIMQHQHENSNTTMEIINDDNNNIKQILILSPLLIIRIDINIDEHIMMLSIGMLSKEWIHYGRMEIEEREQQQQQPDLDGLLGITWKHEINNDMIHGNEDEYIVSSIWNTDDGVHNRYRDDLYNHID